MPKAKLVFAVGNAYRQMAAVGLYISDISIYLPYFGYIFYWLGYRKFLPKLRKNAKVEPFKRALDDFLQAAPDEPTVQGCQRATASNSLFHQIPMGRVTNGCQLRWKLKNHHVKNKTCENFKQKKTIDLFKWWFAAWKIEQLFIHSSVASNLSNIDGKGHKVH